MEKNQKNLQNSSSDEQLGILPEAVLSSTIFGKRYNDKWTLADLRGRHGTRPLQVQILSISCRFWEKFGQITAFHIHLWSWRTRGNLGSATGRVNCRNNRLDQLWNQKLSSNWEKWWQAPTPSADYYNPNPGTSRFVNYSTEFSSKYSQSDYKAKLVSRL